MCQYLEMRGDKVLKRLSTNRKHSHAQKTHTHSLQVFGLGRGGIDVALQKFPKILQILVSHGHLPLNQQDVLVGMR